MSYKCSHNKGALVSNSPFYCNHDVKIPRSNVVRQIKVGVPSENLNYRA